MDICVVLYHNTAQRAAAAVRPCDTLWIRDNTSDNIGFAAAANELAAKGTAPLICFMNPDGDSQPGCLDLLENALGDQNTVAAEPSQGGAYVGRVTADRHRWLSGACMVVRRCAFEAVGGFDVRLFMYGEDVDLSFRLAKMGRLVHCWEAEFRHDGGRRSFRSERLQARNGLVLHARYDVGPGVVGMVRGVGAALRGHDLNLAAARLWGIGAFMAHRRKL